MCGRLTDSSIWYDKHSTNALFTRHYRYQQAIESFKINGDNTWHAGALEGLCSALVLEAQATGVADDYLDLTTLM